LAKEISPINLGEGSIYAHCYLPQDFRPGSTLSIQQQQRPALHRPVM
jgi:hypothetical protein